MNTDPTGEDIYSVDELGNIRFQTATEDSYDTLIATNTQSSINVDKGIFNNSTSEIVHGKNETVTVNTYTLEGYNTDLHEFLAKNTSVEWSSIQYVGEGNVLKTQIGTSHIDGADYSMMYIANTITEENGSIMTATHNHTNNSTTVSAGDIKVASNIIENHPFAEFYILTTEPTFKRTEYTPQSTAGLLDEITVTGFRTNKMNR